MISTFRLCSMMMMLLPFISSAQQIFTFQHMLDSVTEPPSNLRSQVQYSYNVHLHKIYPLLSLNENVGSRSTFTYVADSIPPKILWKPFELTTIGNQLLTGTCALGLTAAIFIPVAGIAAKNTSGEGSIAAGVGVMIIGAVVASASFPAGVTLGGKWSGGNGSFWWTFAGCITAGGIALIPNIIAGTDENNAALIRVPIAVFIGSILGYHFSASPVYASEKESGLQMKREVRLSLHDWQRTLPPKEFSLTILSVSL